MLGICSRRAPKLSEHLCRTGAPVALFATLLVTSGCTIWPGCAHCEGNTAWVTKGFSCSPVDCGDEDFCVERTNSSGSMVAGCAPRGAERCNPDALPGYHRFRCDGNDVQECNGLGVWDGRDCGTDQRCIALPGLGAECFPVDAAPCDPAINAYECRGNEVWYCHRLRWWRQLSDCASSKECAISDERDAGGCVDIGTGYCEFGVDQPTCIGNTPVWCGELDRWKSTLPCSSREVCVVVNRWNGPSSRCAWDDVPCDPATFEPYCDGDYEVTCVQLSTDLEAYPRGQFRSACAQP